MVGIVLFLLDIWLARTNQKDEIKIIYLSMEWSLTPTHPPGTSKQKSTYLYHDHTIDSLINATLRTWNLHAIQSLVDSSTPSLVNPVAKPKHSLSPPPRKYHVHWSFQGHQQGIENQTWGTNTLRCNRTVVKIETRIKFFCSCKKKKKINLPRQPRSPRSIRMTNPNHVSSPNATRLNQLKLQTTSWSKSENPIRLLCACARSNDDVDTTRTWEIRAEGT